MHNLEEHVTQAHDSLEAAQTSLNAARHAYERSGSEADAHFLRDAEAAFQEAQSTYEVACHAQEHTAQSG